MPDQATIDSVATKFGAWAQSLSSTEQETLATWWQSRTGDDVTAHTGTWWTEPGTWTRAWTESWTETTWTE